MAEETTEKITAEGVHSRVEATAVLSGRDSEATPRAESTVVLPRSGPPTAESPGDEQVTAVVDARMVRAMLDPGRAPGEAESTDVLGPEELPFQRRAQAKPIVNLPIGDVPSTDARTRRVSVTWLVIVALVAVVGGVALGLWLRGA